MDSSLAEEGYNSGYSHFFITTEDYSSLDGYYAPFGKITLGMNIIDKISKLQTKVNEDGITTEEPINPPTIKYMTVETFGADYPLPEIMESFDIEAWLMNFYGME